MGMEGRTRGERKGGERGKFEEYRLGCWGIDAPGN